MKILRFIFLFSVLLTSWGSANADNQNKSLPSLLARLQEGYGLYLTVHFNECQRLSPPTINKALEQAAESYTRFEIGEIVRHAVLDSDGQEKDALTFTSDHFAKHSSGELGVLHKEFSMFDGGKAIVRLFYQSKTINDSIELSCDSASSFMRVKR